MRSLLALMILGVFVIFIFFGKDALPQGGTIRVIDQGLPELIETERVIVSALHAVDTTDDSTGKQAIQHELDQVRGKVTTLAEGREEALDNNLFEIVLSALTTLPGAVVAFHFAGRVSQQGASAQPNDAPRPDTTRPENEAEDSA